MLYPSESRVPILASDEPGMDSLHRTSRVHQQAA